MEKKETPTIRLGQNKNKDWQVAEKLLKSGQTIELKCISYNKGGLIFAFGQLRGFVPFPEFSQDGKKDVKFSEELLDGLIGQRMRLKVIEVDQVRRRLVLSQIKALTEEHPELLNLPNNNLVTLNNLVLFYLELVLDLTIPLDDHNYSSKQIEAIIRLMKNRIHPTSGSLSQKHAQNIALTIAKYLIKFLSDTLWSSRTIDLDFALAETRSFLRKPSLTMGHAQSIEQLLQYFESDVVKHNSEPTSSLKAALKIARLLAMSITLLVNIAEIQAASSETLPHTLIELNGHTIPVDGFTLDFLATDLFTYLGSIVSINDVLYALQERNSTDIKIRSISYGSATIDLTGGIRETIELVFDLIIPYRRKAQKRHIELDVTNKEVELKQRKVELKKAQATLEADSEQASVDVEKAQAEVALLRQQERELALKNKKQELELFELTLAMVDKIKAGLPDSERLYYATKLLDPTRLIATSPLELISAEPISSADGLGGEPGVQ